MSRDADKKSQEIFRLEQEAEDMSARLYAESQEGLDNRCTACGALGSLEEQDDGEVRCVDCDVVVAQRSKLGGYGRK